MLDKFILNLLFVLRNSVESVKRKLLNLIETAMFVSKLELNTNSLIHKYSFINTYQNETD